MAELPYSFENAPGLKKYRVSTMLKDYLTTLMEDEENKEKIDQILSLINGYIDQLSTLRIKNRTETMNEVYKAIDTFFANGPDENKKEIQCKEDCTACCFIDVEISGDEAISIINYCNKKRIEIDKEYLMKQAAASRQSYSDLSRCVFLKDNLCSIYTVRPVACRKHWVKTDPALCDYSDNIIKEVGGYFDINTEILASTLLNMKETGSFEKVLLKELDKPPSTLL